MKQKDHQSIEAIIQNPTQKTVFINDNQIMNLQTFICVASHLSFAIAAEKLFISPSAVSHRISKLEKSLGFELFYRFTRKIKLTNKGERLFDILSTSFDKINDEIQDIQSNELSGTLSILSHPSIANEWLIPHIADFQKKYPFINLTILTGNETVDFQSNAIDLALYYANGFFPGINNEKLMEEEIFPVCSIEYAEQHNLINNPDNLRYCTLLHDAKAWHLSAKEAEWHIWCKHHSINLMDNRNYIFFDSSISAISAAEYHAGIAIGRKQVVKNKINKKTLISPFSLPPLKTNFDYYIVWPRLQKSSLRLNAFIQWIKNQTQIDNHY